ncbi:elongation factor G [Candidatus Woesebacteria bacterium]|nr:elongation factor G [Candidatus Woesebacteria bacterium]MCD8507649.1 elongation factor G [Candidatus Woesebacteria bacterium]MCD8526766.1 elongation factor G [Candidatus Woesebacteria bacterium]MCD8546489.1 elongation factor G [Candidatus Woesebacteria bacterium]
MATQQTVKTDDRNLPLDRIRNIGIIAHIDAGKTTTTERILYFTGKSYKIGEVHEGEATMDWMEQERERGITIVSAATTTFWTPVLEQTLMPQTDHRINIIDTPGHVDFTAEVERSLRVLDGGVTVLDADKGVQSQSETVWRQADKYHVPRLCFVNKMDKVGANFDFVVGDVKEKFGVTPAPMVMPMGAENEFRGLVQLLEMRALHWADQEASTPYEVIDVPEEFRAKAEEKRAELVEMIVETDEELMNKYLEGEEISVAELKKALRKAVINYELVPMFCGSALKNMGIQPLLDAIVDYLPSPQDVDHITGTNPDTGEEVTRQLVPTEPLAMLAFKVQTDPHVGRITYARIYSGKLEAGSYIYNATQKEKERVGRVLLMHANQREEIQAAYAGEIVALVGLKATRTGDSLCEESAPIVLEGITFAEPVISLAIEPATKSDQEKMGMALAKLSEEDPTFQVKVNHDTNQTIIAGMGELHLEIIVDRMKREFKVDANVGAPQVAYRETIKAPTEQESKYIKQSGGRGQYGHVYLRLEPMDRGTGFEFVNAITGGAIPKEFITPVQKGVEEAMANGVMAGYPMVDMKVTLYDGSYHDVDSSEIAFKLAASMGLQSGARKAGLQLLEPIMRVEVTTPKEFMGDVIGDLSSRRGLVQGSTEQGTAVVIKGQVPLAELPSYATILRSMTQGRASYYMEPSHYEVVPDNIAQQIVEQQS